MSGGAITALKLVRDFLQKECLKSQYAWPDEIRIPLTALLHEMMERETEADLRYGEAMSRERKLA